MDISIIIVTYQSKEKALKCIKAIKDSDLSGISYEIILADNASPDKIGKDINNEHSDIIFIQNEKNLGMGAGNNAGIEKSRGEFILILNADTYVEKNTIKMLYDQAKKNPDIGIIGPKLFYPDGTLQITCYRFPKIYTFVLRRTFLGFFFKKYLDDFLMTDFNHDQTSDVDWIMGSCLLVRKKITEKIGKVFDDRYWMYFEDTDLCRRTWKAGYGVIYYPLATAVHDHGRGSAKYPWYSALFKNRLARAHIISWFKYFCKWGLSNTKPPTRNRGHRINAV
jgi:GT2 family glycosyltransferase